MTPKYKHQKQKSTSGTTSNYKASALSHPDAPLIGTINDQIKIQIEICEMLEFRTRRNLRIHLIQSPLFAKTLRLREVQLGTLLSIFALSKG